MTTARDEAIQLAYDVYEDESLDATQGLMERVVDALLANPEVVLRALGGRRYGQIPHEDGWEWHLPDESRS